MIKYSLLLVLFLQSVLGFAQNTTTSKIGKTFNITYPSTFYKTYDLNDSASLQLSNNTQNKHTIVIQDDKESLLFYKVIFSSLDEGIEFYSKNLYNGITDNAAKKKSTITKKTINGYKAAEITIEGDILDDETQETTPISYLFTLIETPSYYYQIVSWTLPEDMPKFLPEFRTIASSLKEVD